MKAVVVLALGLLSLAARAEGAHHDPVTAPDSFSQQSQEKAQLPDVDERAEAQAASLMPAFATEPQNQALMLGGLLAMGFMVRRRRD